MPSAAPPEPTDTLPRRLRVAAHHLATRIPKAEPGDLVGVVRGRLPDHDWESLDDVAVCIDDRLLGLVTLERLMAAPADAPVGDVMDDTPPVVSPDLVQEVAAWQMVMQNESSLAVVEDGRFLGLIPPFAMLRVLLEEHDEDMQRVGGVLVSTASARTASEEPIPRRLWHRLPWLIVGLVGAMGSAALLAGFEDSLIDHVELAFFLPAIVYMADAVGTQTETLAIRGLSVGVSIRVTYVKELLTGGLIGALIAACFFPFALVLWDELSLATTVSLSLLVSCSIASAVALLLPWAFHRAGRDPAFGSGPLATVVQDLLSLLVYLAIATLLVG